MLHWSLSLSDGYTIPQLGLGVWQARSGVETERAVTAAFAAGYRLIDTAAAYGNERSVGRAIAKSTVARGDMFITTKLWNADHGYKQTMRACRRSLRALGLTYVDLYLIHWPLASVPRRHETWRALEQLQREGLVRSIGVSNFTSEHLSDLFTYSKIRPVVNQIEVNPQFQQTPLRKFCRDHSIVVESWSPLGGGALLRDATILDIAKKHDVQPAQIIIRWHLQSQLVVIPKSTHVERINENYDIRGFELDSGDMARIACLDSDVRIGAHPNAITTTLPTRLVQLAHRFRLVHW